MISFDTNILLYALNSDCVEHEAARAVVGERAKDTNVVLAELVLVELYILLRNSAVLSNPLSSERAVETVETFRSNPRWKVVDSAPIMDRVWTFARTPGIARRRIIDARIAFTLQHHGVTRFVTRNERDFADLGFEEVSNPIDL